MGTDPPTELDNLKAQIETSKSIISRLLDMFDGAAENDDACVGYKSRRHLQNEALLFVGENSLGPPPESWRD